MKGLSGSRSHHHGVTCDSACDSLSHHADRKPYMLSPVEHHPADHPYYTQRTSFQAECVGPFSDPLASSTFPRRHYTSQQELKDECALVPRTLATKANRIPANLLDQFERQLPLNRDGYHTLQYKRTAVEHRSDSPGRIRHLVHSVQKLFTKSHSLEGPSKGSVNGGKASPEETQTVRYGKRSKSKERRPEPKPRNNASPGWWSSEDNLDGDMCIYHAPSGVMTMGRCPDRSASQYFMEAYNTISEQAVKASRSNNDVKCTTCANLPVTLDAPLLKKSAWSSTLTVSRAREVYQKASVNMDQAMVKSESCQQERSCQYLQVPQDEWTGYTPRGKDDEIPCRRMRSGSYIKAMGDEDSGDSDTSPKPSPKVAARRESYLKATQPSLTELTTLKISNEHSPKLQIRSHSYLRAVSEVSINRSLDSLDPAGLLTSPKFRSRNESYMRAMSTISQVSEMEVNGQFESVCESVFSELESQAVEALDLPMPGCFRMRSHSYVRAIEKGCSQDDECVSLRSSSPPRTTTTVRTIQSSTGVIKLSSAVEVSSCITTYKKTPPPVPPRTTTKPFISITAQSSTESAQDAYMDGQGQRGDIISQSGLSNSTESLDSMKALTAAIEAANAQIHGPASQHMGNNAATITTTTTAMATITAEDRKKDHFKKNRCLSIGIQVDDAEEPNKTGENKAPSKFQSIGVQVEEEKCSQNPGSHVPSTRAYGTVYGGRVDQSEPKDPKKPPSGILQVKAQSDHLTLKIAVDEHLTKAQTSPEAFTMPFKEACGRVGPKDGETQVNKSCLVKTETKNEGLTTMLSEDVPCLTSKKTSELAPTYMISKRASPSRRLSCSGFLCGRRLLFLPARCPVPGGRAPAVQQPGPHRRRERLWDNTELGMLVLGKIRTAVGSAQLLMAQKFYQFRELCEENLNPNAHPRPTSQDLAGFWDMLQLSIENISMKFDELHQLKANNWKQMDPLDKKERRAPPPVPKKPAKGPAPLIRERSLESSQRQEARKRLMAAKRAASVRQNSATESAESIEIYIPEAQTRL
ncbi:disks large-associated protein 1 [Monodon monoceros]|uniref:disks large-associated protein 1 n=1 Tax=Monodon monoceros TaxID=40151 RepID=UPI0010F6D804|nr:disks large-associated protein 1 [Monodon monoceros]